VESGEGGTGYTVEKALKRAFWAFSLQGDVFPIGHLPCQEGGSAGIL
jgi:hypothetical protein